MDHLKGVKRWSLDAISIRYVRRDQCVVAEQVQRAYATFGFLYSYVLVELLFVEGVHCYLYADFSYVSIHDPDPDPDPVYCYSAALLILVFFVFYSLLCL